MAKLVEGVAPRRRRARVDGEFGQPDVAACNLPEVVVGQRVARGDADHLARRRRAPDVVREREADHDVLHHVRRQIGEQLRRHRACEIGAENALS